MEELLNLYSNNENQLANIENQIMFAVGELINQKNELIAKNDEIKEKIKEAMEKNEVKKFENDFISITYVAPTTKQTLDTKKVKEEYEDIYNKCLKTSDVKSSVRIKVKEINTKEEIKEPVEIDMAELF